MGALQLIQSKPNLTPLHFLQAYQETTSPEYFSSTRSFGLRASHNNIKQPQNLPPIAKKLVKEAGMSKRVARLCKKQVSDPFIYPYSCIGLLLVDFEGMLRCGTGSLISHNVILTAAANIFDRESQTMAREVKFVLHVNGHQGDIYNISLDKIHFPEQFSQEAEGSHRYNYAFLEIDSKDTAEQPLRHQQLSESQQKPGSKYEKNGHNDERLEQTDDKHGLSQKSQVQNDVVANKPGLSHGYLGFSTSFREIEPIYIFGFSGELNEKQQLEYRMRGEKISALVCKDSAFGYKMESFPSEVGSPIMVRRNEYYQIVGMHMGGKKGLSCGLQFDEQIRNHLNSWLWQSQGSIHLANRAISTREISQFIEMPWHNMVVINLDNNKIICEGLQVLTSKPWPRLKQLRLCHNSIAKLNFDPSSLINLEKLYLSFNAIRQVTALAELPLLKVLDLAANKIESVEDLFSLKYLQRLDLSKTEGILGTNRLKTIGGEVCRMQRLKKLYLSRNQLICLPPDLLKLSNLLTMAIDRNKFKPAPADLISQLRLQHVEVILQ